MAKIPRFVLLVLCLSINALAFCSNTKFLYEGFVNYDINGYVFKEFQMLGGRKMANCSQECILENECTRFELCEVDSSQMCRLTNDSPNPKPSLDNSAPCRHFIRLSHNLYSCDRFSTTDECIKNSLTGTYSECFDCDCVSSQTSVSGVYEITSPVTNSPILVECVMRDRYGFTVILQRHDRSVEFNRTYAEYQDGFGSPFTEMWLGNEYFHNLTPLGSRLYIELKYNDSSFRRNCFRFGTHDMDPYSCGCAMLKYGGWWDSRCSETCGLTMPYNDLNYPFGWDCSIETTIKLTSVKMMARRM